MDNAKFITFVSLHKTVFFGLASVLVLLLIVSKGKNVIYDCVHKADDINAAGGFSHPLQLHKDLSSNMVQSAQHRLSDSGLVRFSDRETSEAVASLSKTNSVATLEADVPRIASEKNQVMDTLLNQARIPPDYGETMISLYRGKSQDVLTRDFAVQHIGLYAQALSRRGKYVPESEDARNCRAALFDAASETPTIVAAAAFRALADMSEFDSRVDTRRLDALLVSCAADASATPASRAMAVQLCGERRIAASRPAIEKAASDPAAGEVVRRSAKYALAMINNRDVAQ